MRMQSFSSKGLFYLGKGGSGVCESGRSLCGGRRRRNADVKQNVLAPTVGKLPMPGVRFDQGLVCQLSTTGLSGANEGKLNSNHCDNP